MKLVLFDIVRIILHHLLLLGGQTKLIILYKLKKLEVIIHLIIIHRVISN